MDETGTQERRPGLVALLIAIYFWLLIWDSWKLLGFELSIEYQLFAAVDLDYVYFFFTFLAACLDGATLWYLCNPKPIGFRFALWGLAMSTIYGAIMAGIGSSNPDLMGGLFQASLLDTGLKLPQEALRAMASNEAIQAGVQFRLAVDIVSFVVLALLLFWCRTYFDGPPDAETVEEGPL